VAYNSVDLGGRRVDQANRIVDASDLIICQAGLLVHVVLTMASVFRIDRVVLLAADRLDLNLRLV